MLEFWPQEKMKNFRLKRKRLAYLLTGNTCLAGDVMGEYAFDKKLKIGDKIVF